MADLVARLSGFSFTHVFVCCLQIQTRGQMQFAFFYFLRRNKNKHLDDNKLVEIFTYYIEMFVYISTVFF